MGLLMRETRTQRYWGSTRTLAVERRTATRYWVRMHHRQGRGGACAPGIEIGVTVKDNAGLNVCV